MRCGSFENVEIRSQALLKGVFIYFNVLQIDFWQNIFPVCLLLPVKLPTPVIHLTWTRRLFLINLCLGLLPYTSVLTA